MLIDAEAGTVWKLLTETKLMEAWMGEPEMKIEIKTNWEINSSISIKGFHHVYFENTGFVLGFEENRFLSYSHLNSISRLPDKKENYSIIEFYLQPNGRYTDLKIILKNFQTETIFKHLQFYWMSTIGVIKDLAEQKQHF